MKKLTIGKVAYILIITILGAILFCHPSVEIYWMQTYHQPSPLQAIQNKSMLQLIAQVDSGHRKISDQLTDIQSELNIYNESLRVKSNQLLQLSKIQREEDPPTIISKVFVQTLIGSYYASLEKSQENIHNLDGASNSQESEEELESLIVDIMNEENTQDLQEQSDNTFSEINSDVVGLSLPLTLKEQDYFNQKIILRESDVVFYAGDSLMQGIAPWARRTLLKNHKVNALDLSKQSTGLSYPHALDWPRIIEEELDYNPSIKVLVVFLGPNDPWSFPLKRGSKKYLKFKTPDWEAEYRARIDRILDAAKKHRVKVVWLEVPCMKKQELNDGISYLNTLYQSEVERYGQLFLPTYQLLGCEATGYSNLVEIDGKMMKVRSDDGIHFNPRGQKILADAIISQFELIDMHQKEEKGEPK